MGRVAHSRLDELRKCAQPMSWMDDDEVIDVLNELWSARETINDVSAKLIQDERQLAAQAAEIERLTKEAVANEAAIACAEGIHQQQAAELAALRSQLEEQRAKTIDVLEEADDYVSCTPYNERPEESNQRNGFLKVLREHVASLKST